MSSVLVYMTLYGVGEDYEPLSYAKHTVRINKAYADKHGYDFKVFSYPEEGMSDRHPVWTRAFYARQQCKDYDYLLYIDGDAFVHDDSVSVEDLANKYFFNEDTVVLAARDQKLRTFIFHYDRPNAGVFLIKCGNYTQSLLDEWWRVPDDSYYSGKLIFDAGRYLDNSDSKTQHPYEQLALWFLRDRYPKHFRFTEDYRELNGLDGTFIRHLMQVSDADRVKILTAFSNNINEDQIK